jgi:lipopolysaccharide export system protein LptC
MAADRYSRTVSFLKVALPLAALGLLSTLFLLGRTVETTQVVPFAEPEIRDRLLNQQVTEPHYAGVSADGDEITFVAATVTTPGALDGAKNAENVEATFNMANGTQIDVTSDVGFFDLSRDYASLTGAVVIETSRGYIVRSEQLYGKMSQLDLHSPDRVEGTMPGGDLTAGSMALTVENPGDPAHLLFRGGVKLVYDPKSVGE